MESYPESGGHVDRLWNSDDCEARKVILVIFVRLVDVPDVFKEDSPIYKPVLLRFSQADLWTLVSCLSIYKTSRIYVYSLLHLKIYFSNQSFNSRPFFRLPNSFVSNGPCKKYDDLDFAAATSPCYVYSSKALELVIGYLYATNSCQSCLADDLAVDRSAPGGVQVCR